MGKKKQIAKTTKQKNLRVNSSNNPIGELIKDGKAAEVISLSLREGSKYVMGFYLKSFSAATFRTGQGKLLFWNFWQSLWFYSGKGTFFELPFIKKYLA